MAPRLALLVVLVAALALAGGASTGSAAPSSAQRSPTLLWHSYPLVQRRAAAESRPPALAAALPNSFALRAGPGKTGVVTPTMLLLLLGSLIAACAGVLLVRSALAELRDEAGRRR